MWSNTYTKRKKRACRNSTQWVTSNNPIELLLNLITSPVTQKRFSLEVFLSIRVICGIERWLMICLVFIKHSTEESRITPDKMEFDLEMLLLHNFTFIRFGLFFLPSNMYDYLLNRTHIVISFYRPQRIKMFLFLSKIHFCYYFFLIFYFPTRIHFDDTV